MSGLRNAVPASAQPQGLSAVRTPSRETNIPDYPGFGNSKLPAVAGGMLAGAALAPADAQAAIPADQYRFPAAEPGWVNPEPPLETPLFSPIELALAPVGVAKASGKVAAVAAEPFVAWGMSVFALKKEKREAAAPRRPAQSERKNRVFSAKRQAVWFETRCVSN